MLGGAISQTESEIEPRSLNERDGLPVPQDSLSPELKAKALEAKKDVLSLSSTQLLEKYKFKEYESWDQVEEILGLKGNIKTFDKTEYPTTLLPFIQTSPATTVSEYTTPNGQRHYIFKMERTDYISMAVLQDSPFIEDELHCVKVEGLYVQAGANVIALNQYGAENSGNPPTIRLGVRKGEDGNYSTEGVGFFKNTNGGEITIPNISNMAGILTFAHEYGHFVGQQELEKTTINMLRKARSIKVLPENLGSDSKFFIIESHLLNKEQVVNPANIKKIQDIYAELIGLEELSAWEIAGSLVAEQMPGLVDSLYHSKEVFGINTYDVGVMDRDAYASETMKSMSPDQKLYLESVAKFVYEIQFLLHTEPLLRPRKNILLQPIDDEFTINQEGTCVNIHKYNNSSDFLRYTSGGGKSGYLGITSNNLRFGIAGEQVVAGSYDLITAHQLVADLDSEQISQKINELEADVDTVLEIIGRVKGEIADYYQQKFLLVQDSLPPSVLSKLDLSDKQGGNLSILWSSLKETFENDQYFKLMYQVESLGFDDWSRLLRLAQEIEKQELDKDQKILRDMPEEKREKEELRLIKYLIEVASAQSEENKK